MKQIYEVPEMTVVLFENEDIVTSSGITGGAQGDNDLLYGDLIE